MQTNLKAAGKFYSQRLIMASRISISQITNEKPGKIRKLNDPAYGRDQTLAQMALAWLLEDSRITSVLIGASTPAQVKDAVACLKNPDFNSDELKTIESVLK